MLCLETISVTRILIQILFYVMLLHCIPKLFFTFLVVMIHGVLINQSCWFSVYFNTLALLLVLV